MSEVFTPFDYQQRTLDFCEDKDSVGLFLSCGMGKTPITLKIIADRILEGRCRGVLIVAPIRVGLITWPTQVRRWEHSAWLKCVNLRTPQGMEAWKKGTADIYLINPEMMPKLLPQMMKQKRIPTDMLVIDERNVVCNNYNEQVFEALARHGVTPHVCNFRHRFFWDGGLHCNTLDLVREGSQIDYFPNQFNN
jgi:hypothetical protein